MGDFLIILGITLTFLFLMHLANLFDFSDVLECKCDGKEKTDG